MIRHRKEQELKRLMTQKAVLSARDASKVKTLMRQIRQADESIHLTNAFEALINVRRDPRMHHDEAGRLGSLRRRCSETIEDEKVDRWGMKTRSQATLTASLRFSLFDHVTNQIDEPQPEDGTISEANSQSAKAIVDEFRAANTLDLHRRRASSVGDLSLSRASVRPANASMTHSRT